MEEVTSPPFSRWMHDGIIAFLIDGFILDGSQQHFIPSFGYQFILGSAAGKFNAIESQWKVIFTVQFA